MSMYRKNAGPIKDRFFIDIQRRVSAAKLVESWEQGAPAALSWDLDVSKVYDHIQSLKQKDEYKDVRLTMNSAMLKIIAKGLEMCPVLNSHFIYNRKKEIGELFVFEEVNIAQPFVTKSGKCINEPEKILI